MDSGLHAPGPAPSLPGRVGGEPGFVKHDAADPLRFSHGPKQASPFGTVTAAFYHHARSSPRLLAARDLSSKSAVAREVDYGTLARRSSRLASRLRQLGVSPGDRVPLVVKRGIEMLVGIMAVLSCGAQYVPLDGGVVPDSTLRFVLEQAGGRVALCLASTEYRVRAVCGGCTAVVIPVDEADDEGPEVVLDSARPDDGCYVIYTSGTTGTPKGVDVTHRNVTNLLCLSPGGLGIKPGMRVGQVLNISFDMAAWEILGCLCNGGTLVLRGSDWAPTIREIDVFICTPSILSKYNPADFPNIKIVATAGEPSSQRLADLWATHGTYYNCCGPTETTIVNTMDRHVPGAPLSIGFPTPNNGVYILDDERRPVPLGAPGVMWAGGLGVSRGYVGLPDKTAERYLPDPFSRDGGVMYNTGDLGRWNANGSIDILGRVDDQIKIKGFRVELDGVSASLAAGPGVAHAVALLVGQEIHGFLEPADVDLEALREHMAKCQPYYAVPSRLHRLADLPRTANGKIDKRALRDLAGAEQKLQVPALLLPRASDGNLSQTTASSSSSTLDLETTKTKALATPTTAATSTESLADEKAARVREEHKPELPDLSAPLPAKKRPGIQRNLVYRAFIVYRTLFSFVGIANAIALVAILSVAGVDPDWLANMTAINLVVAVLIRQDFVINALYTVCCSLPRSWPLAIRARAAKVYHLGGAHSGAAFCAAAWLLVSNVRGAVCSALPESSAVCRTAAAAARPSVATTVLSWILTGMFASMLASAWPPLRKKRHDVFERVHRFLGWTMLGLFWAQTVVAARDDALASGVSLGRACLRSVPLWLLAVATCSIASSWLFLRRVPVDAEVLSDHAVRLHFDYVVPVNGSFTRISQRPLLEWHSFATVPAPEADPEHGHPRGYSLVVSNAGDWTRQLIRDPPRSLWVRGVPTCGVMRIATLFSSVVVIGTGSGIGPLMGHIQRPSCATRLIWSTPDPERTFGKKIIDSIRRTIPDAVIHDTRKLGRPDLVRMGYNLAREAGAEAVIIIANEKITKKVVYGLETRGVHAYGAIWDS